MQKNPKINKIIITQRYLNSRLESERITLLSCRTKIFMSFINSANELCSETTSKALHIFSNQ